MAIELINEVLDYAPAGLTPQERLAAVVFAEDARLFNRPGEERHRHLARKILTSLDDKLFQQRIGVSSAKKVQELAQALARKGVLESVQRGQKHRAAEYRFAHLAPPQQAENWGAEASQDPEKWGAEKAAEDLSAPETGAQNGLSTPDTVPQHPGKWGASSVVRKKTPSLPLPQRLLREAELGLSEDEETRFIAFADTIGVTGKKGSPWWRTVVNNGGLPDLVEDWRAAESADPVTARASPASRLCADCDGRFTPTDPSTDQCPDCRGEETP